MRRKTNGESEEKRYVDSSKRFTNGEPKKVITSTRGDTIMKAWQKLTRHCEPALAIREAQAISE